MKLSIKGLMAEWTHVILLMLFVTFRHKGMGVDLVSRLFRQMKATSEKWSLMEEKEELGEEQTGKNGGEKSSRNRELAVTKEGLWSNLILMKQ